MGASADKEAVRQTTHQYNPAHYKCAGSIIYWALANKLHDAFMVWMLAQKYDRTKHRGKTTGRITSIYFIDWLSKNMSVDKKTAKKRLQRALRYGFLDYLSTGYTITSHRRMVEVAMDDQYRRHSDDQGVNPVVLLDADREFTRPFNGWVMPTSMYTTKALMSGRLMQQGTILARGRERQGNLAGCSSRTMIRRTEDADVVVQPRYIRLDPNKMLVEATCTTTDAIDAFTAAEDMYRSKGGQLPGCKFLHKKYISSAHRTCLVIQIANAYCSKSDVKEVPAKHKRHSWIRKSSDPHPRRPIEKAGDSLRQLPNSYTTWKTGAFVKSVDWGDIHVPENVLQSMMRYLQDITHDPDCAELIMLKTGATAIKSVYMAEPRGWKTRTYGVTPCLTGREIYFS